MQLMWNINTKWCPSRNPATFEHALCERRREKSFLFLSCAQERAEWWNASEGDHNTDSYHVNIAPSSSFSSLRSLVRASVKCHKNNRGRTRANEWQVGKDRFFRKGGGKGTFTHCDVLGTSVINITTRHEPPTEQEGNPARPNFFYETVVAKKCCVLVRVEMF